MVCGGALSGLLLLSLLSSGFGDLSPNNLLQMIQQSQRYGPEDGRERQLAMAMNLAAGRCANCDADLLNSADINAALQQDEGHVGTSVIAASPRLDHSAVGTTVHAGEYMLAQQNLLKQLLLSADEDLVQDSKKKKRSKKKKHKGKNKKEKKKKKKKKSKKDKKKKKKDKKKDHHDLPDHNDHHHDDDNNHHQDDDNNHHHDDDANKHHDDDNNHHHHGDDDNHHHHGSAAEVDLNSLAKIIRIFDTK